MTQPSNERTQLPTLVDAYAASTALYVPPATIRKWASRGHITKHGQDLNRRTLYDLNELRRYALGGDTMTTTREKCESCNGYITIDGHCRCSQ